MTGQQDAANTGVPNYGIAKDFPLHDERERLGGDRDPLGAEIEAALHELWDARREQESNPHIVRDYHRVR